MSRLRRLLFHWPLIMAVIFSAFTLILLWSLYSSQSRLRIATDARLVAESQRRASAVEEFVLERRQAVLELAGSHEIEAYLVNRALGMSPQYGLNTALDAIEQRFRQQIEQKTHRGHPVYQRIVFLGVDGAILAEAGKDGPVAPIPAVPENTPSLLMDAKSWRIVASAPVIHKDVFVGKVVTLSDLRLLSTLLVTGSEKADAASKYQEFLLTDEGHFIPGPEQTMALAGSVGRTLTGLPEKKLIAAADIPGAEQFRNMLALRTSIAGSPLSMLTLMAETDAYGHLASPAYVLLLATFSAGLLLAAFGFERMQKRAMQLQYESAESDRHRAALEQRNEALSAEISRRQAVEAALYDKTAELDKSNVDLRASRERLDFALQGTNDGLWDWNLQTNEVYYAPRWKSMLGYADHELAGTLDTAAQLIDPEQKGKVFQQVTNYLEGRSKIFEIEFRMRHKAGHWVDILSRAKLARDAEGRPLVPNRLVGTHLDISERKLLEANQRIAAIAFESQEGMFVTDAGWVILRVNNAFCAITGYSAEEAVGRLPQQLLGSGRHAPAFYAAMSESVKRSGTWQGEVWDRRKNGEVYPEWLTITAVKDDAGQITNYVATLSDITARKAAEDEIRNLAFYDPLTGLPNRRLLMDRLEHALTASARHLRYGAILFIDLDNFKDLNDTFGHDKGDLLLQQVARRLLTCVREGDTVARLGGDEFVVMLESLGENALDAATHAEAVGEKILVTLAQIYLLAGHAHHSTPSIGVTLFAGQRETIDELLKRADLAMYQAKAAGRNTLRFFDPHMQTVVTTRAALEAGLREAVAKKQFLLHYQAQVTGEGHLMGAEALVRWMHPQRGMMLPTEFIPLAEETGVILLVGRWVLETACAQLAIWASRPEMAHLTIAVNVSARQFLHRDFVDEVQTVLEHSGANPQRLKLELTESLLVSNVEDVIAKMSALKAKGVGFALDDFGTGYSSLSYLKRLPLEQLKIDQSFVRDILIDPNDAAIAKMIIALGESLGLMVMAEGVEVEAQRESLARLGCHAYQGHLFSHPLPLEEFEQFVTRG